VFTHTIPVAEKTPHKTQRPLNPLNSLPVAEPTQKRSVPASQDTRHRQAASCRLQTVKKLQVPAAEKQWLLYREIYRRGKQEKALSNSFYFETKLNISFLNIDS